MAKTSVPRLHAPFPMVMCEHCAKVFQSNPIPSRFCSVACFNNWKRTLLVERFWRSVLRTATCWDWQGRTDQKGYGQIYGEYQGKSRNWLAHRLSYMIHGGIIPPSMTIDHLCRNHGCVNPEHLEVVTVGENVRRGESFSTRNKRKTHCPQGHPYDEENTFLLKNGGRMCRACSRVRALAYQARKRREQALTHGHNSSESSTTDSG